MAALSSLGEFKNTGLLLIRIGLGVMFIMHGYPKLAGGPEYWEKVGGAIGHLGIDFMPIVWGFLAAVTETIGGLFIIIGFFFRPTSILLAFTMLTASIHHLKSGDGLMGASHAIEIGFVFLGLVFVGPGKFSVDKR